MRKRLKAEREVEQICENDREIGDIELREWGVMLRVESWPGPKGSPPCPMFKDMKTRYPETREVESYDADKAERVLEVVQAAGLSDKQKGALHIFYADSNTAFNLSKSTERYNKINKTDDPLSHRAFKRVIDDLCVRIGLLVRVKKETGKGVKTHLNR